MYTFSNYKKLDNETRSMATRYWAEVVKNKLGASCPNQILEAHLEKEVTAVAGWSNNSSRFWNRMLKGHPVSLERKVDETDKLLPGTKSLLIHPLWQLMGEAGKSQQGINMALLALPIEFRSMLFVTSPSGDVTRKTKLTSRQEQKLFSMTSMDCLACFLGIGLEARLQANFSKLRIYEMGLLKVLLRLVATGELGSIGARLHSAIENLFFTTQDDFDRVDGGEYSLPIPTRILPYGYKFLTRWMLAYKTSHELSVALNWITTSSEDKLYLHYLVNHVSINTYIGDLRAIQSEELQIEGSDKETQRVYNCLKKRQLP